MLGRRAVQDFMARERRDVRPLKKASKAELRRLKDGLPVKPPIWQKLTKHQRVCFVLGVEHKSFGYHLDMGMGKTLLGIALARYFDKGDLLDGRCVLVLVPNKINCAEWRRELVKWGQRGRFTVLKGSTQAKWEALRKTRALFVIVTYAGFVRMCCTMEKKKRGRGKELRPDPKLVAELKNLIGGMILDESTNVGNREALATRICKQLKKTSAFLYEMTGTPFGRDPTMLHSQLHLIDDGYSLGESLGLFRAAFFSEKRNFWGGQEYTFKSSMQPILNRFLAHSTIRYEAKESDLPRYVPIIKPVSLLHDAHVYADKAMAALRKAKGNFRATKNAFLRMRQISSGWIGYEDEDEGKRAELEFGHNPKMEMLISLIQSTDDKVIVYHEFIFSGAIICRELTKAGISWCRISGETKDHDRVLADFNKANGPKVLVLNNKFSFGPNLQVAKYGVWFEAPCSCIVRKQAERRFRRQHSEHDKVFGIDLVVKKTFDERILSAHKEGYDLMEAVVNGRVKL